MERHPSSATCSPSARMISGLTSACSWSSTSATMTRRSTPTWGAASPIPGASRMVSTMSSISLRVESSTLGTLGHLVRRRRSSTTTMSRTTGKVYREPRCRAASALLAVDEALERSRVGVGDEAGADLAPGGVVHLRDREAIALHALDVGHVAVAAHALVPDRDSADLGLVAHGVAIRLGLAVPLPGIAKPGDAAAVGNVPGAVAVVEMVAAGATATATAAASPGLAMPGSG